MNAQEKETKVLIETDLGNITIKLYNETPLHKENFIKLVKDGTYNGLIFHRVIKDFMIQGGDTMSKDSPINAILGEGDLCYTIPAEINSSRYYHKKGALAAARTGDEVNPQKESSSSQFYLVTGKVHTDQELNMMERNRYERLKQSIMSILQAESRDQIKELYTLGDKTKLTELREKMIMDVENEAQSRKSESQFTEEQRQTYTTIGGTPHLDGAYTVYGEVIEGLDILDKIQQEKTNSNDRPLVNIKMKMKVID